MVSKNIKYMNFVIQTFSVSFDNYNNQNDHVFIQDDKFDGNDHLEPLYPHMKRYLTFINPPHRGQMSHDHIQGLDGLKGDAGQPSW